MTIPPKLREPLGIALIALPFVCLFAFMIYLDPVRAIFVIGIPAATFASIFAGASLLVK